MQIAGAILSLLIGLAFAFLPVAIAFARRNSNKGQVLLLCIASLGIEIIISLVGVYLSSRGIGMLMSNPGMSGTIEVVLVVILALSLILWVAALVKAIRGQKAGSGNSSYDKPQ